jgi:hypothetical protein
MEKSPFGIISNKEKKGKRVILFYVESIEPGSMNHDSMMNSKVRI